MNKDYVNIDDKLINKVQDATGYDYEIIVGIDRETGKIENYIDVNFLITALSDLYDLYEHEKELYDDLKQDVEDNYRPIPPEEQI